MLGLKIFVRVQTFLRKPFSQLLPPCCPTKINNQSCNSQCKYDHTHFKMLLTDSPGPVLQRTSTRTTGRRRISSAPGQIKSLVAGLLAPGLMQLFDYKFQVWYLIMSCIIISHLSASFTYIRRKCSKQTPLKVFRSDFMCFLCFARQHWAKKAFSNKIPDIAQVVWNIRSQPLGSSRGITKNSDWLIVSWRLKTD